MPEERYTLQAEIEGMLIRHNHRQDRLLQILRDVQDKMGFVGDDAVLAVAKGLGISGVQVRSTRDFYAFLYAHNRGAYRILFSDNITDRMAGNQPLFQQMLANFGLQAEQVSADGLVSVGLTSCTGMCDQGPAMLVNERAVTCLTPQRVEAICSLVKAAVPLDQWPADFFTVTDNIRRAGRLLGPSPELGTSIRAALVRGPEGMIKEVGLSRLRGRGGAGFPTSVKWDACRQAPGERRYVVCNADEGEPGTFKDRVLLQTYPGRVFEGMVIAAYAVGAEHGLMYLRAEYRYIRPALEKFLAGMRSHGLLGQNIGGIQGFDFDIEIHLGAGAYVCGEESALIESLEGKAGKPRIRPPFPVTCGYLGQPTVVNNVETFCAVSEIAVKGGGDYAGTGTPASSGTKVLSVCGDCERPGLYEYPFGVTIAQVLKDCGASNTQAVQIGGAAGICLSSDEFERHIAFEDVITAGSFMVFDRRRDMFEVAHNFAHFFRHESCGFCTPCRVGTALISAIMDKISMGRGTAHDLDELARLQEVTKTGSHCGLGQTAANPVSDTLHKFPSAYAQRLAAPGTTSTFDLDAALAGTRALQTRGEQPLSHTGGDV